MEVDRLRLTGVLAVFVFVGFLSFSVFLAPSLPVEVRSTDTIETIFASMIGVVVTGTTLVVTINQLVLSQENGPLGDQHRRMSNTMDVRSYTRDVLGGVVPPDPATLLGAVVAEVDRRSQHLESVIDGADRDPLGRQVAEFTDSLHDNAEKVQTQLQDARFGSFDVVSAALNFNYSWKIYQVERMRTEFDDQLDENGREAFEDLHTALSMYGPIREHVKTLYFEWALVELSQYILYLAVPALVVAAGMLTFVGPETFGTVSVLSIPVLTWVVAIAFTVSLTPFLLFTAYVLRVATVAKHTLAIGPLILRESQK